MSRTRSRSLVVAESNLLVETNPCYPSPTPCWTGTPKAAPLVSYDHMVDVDTGDRKTPNYARSIRLKYFGDGYTLGPASNNTKRVLARNYVPQAWRATVLNGIPSIPAAPSQAFADAPSDNAALMEALAVSNPAFSKNDVQLPVSLLELRELPRMVFSRAKRQGHTNSAVEYNFGWAPLISDIRKLFAFPETMERRLASLASLARGASSRQVTVYRGSYHQLYGYQSTESSWYPVYPTADSRPLYRWTREIRVTVNWESTLPTGLTADGKAQLARQLALGLHPDQFLQNAWELLPWSWLIDYFYNVGDLIASRNRSIAKPTRTCLSQVDECKVTHQVTSGPPKGGRPFGYVVRRWERRPLNSTVPLPDLQMPILSTRQAVTLASIAFNSRMR